MEDIQQRQKAIRQQIENLRLKVQQAKDDDDVSIETIIAINTDLFALLDARDKLNKELEELK